LLWPGHAVDAGPEFVAGYQFRGCVFQRYRRLQHLLQARLVAGVGGIDRARHPRLHVAVLLTVALVVHQHAYHLEQFVGVVARL
jgi:hypothetical protein